MSVLMVSRIYGIKNGVESKLQRLSSGLMDIDVDVLHTVHAAEKNY